jgi:hypothetical protein
MLIHKRGLRDAPGNGGGAVSELRKRVRAPGIDAKATFATNLAHIPRRRP